MENIRKYLTREGWKKDLGQTLEDAGNAIIFCLVKPLDYVIGLFPFDEENYAQKCKENEKLRNQVRELEEINSFLKNVNIFPGTIEQYEHTYGKKVRIIEIPEEIKIKGVSLEERHLFIISSNQEFNYSGQLLHTPGINSLWLKEKGLVAIVEARKYIRKKEDYCKDLVEGYFGLPVSSVAKHPADSENKDITRK